MKHRQLERLSTIIDELWQLHQETADRVAQQEIRKVRGQLLILHDACRRVHAEGVAS